MNTNLNTSVKTREDAVKSIDAYQPVWEDDGWHPGMVKRYMLVEYAYIDDKPTAVETLGYVDNDLRDDEAVWRGMAPFTGMIEVLEPEDQPHGGLTCEITGRMFEEPWFAVGCRVDPLDCDGTSFIQGAENALRDVIDNAEQYAIEGWTVDHLHLEGKISLYRDAMDRETTGMLYGVRMNRIGRNLETQMSVEKLEYGTPQEYVNKSKLVKTQAYVEPLETVEDDDLDDENSPRYIPIDALRDFFHLEDGVEHMTYETIKGQIVLRQRGHAVRIVDVSQVD